MENEVKPGGYQYGQYNVGQQPNATSRDPRQRRNTAAAIIAVLLWSGMIAGLFGAALRSDLRDDEDWSQSSHSNFESDHVTPPPVRADGSVAAIAAEVLDSTVYIEAVTPMGSGSGTGMVLRSDGYIVTNNHVIGDAVTAGGTISVTFSDGDVQQAEVVGRTEDYDLAVLKVDRTDLIPLTLADSDQVVVGDPVIAVGAPLGLQGTVTTGIVSALNRAVTAGSANDVSYINAIQTDAAINPGNSGGPLVNMQGEVIGINSAIAQAPGNTAATGSIGLGFAIPSNQVARTTAELIENGYATYPIIGVILDGNYTGQGAMVAESAMGGTVPVTPGGPGDQAGVQPGDVIMAIDGRPVTSPDEVIVAIRAHAPGDTITLSILRGGAELQLDVTLGEQQAN